MPPHAAPLGMLYYHGAKFPELEGKLIVGLHGYRPTGSRVIFYDVDAKGFPAVSPPPVRYGVSCAAEPTRVFQTAPGSEVAAAPFIELMSGWYKVNGVRPQGAPVGMTVAADGAIWLVEDKNKTILRIDVAPPGTAEALPCDARTEAQIAALVGFVARTPRGQRLTQVRSQLIEQHCPAAMPTSTSSPAMSDAQKDTAVLRFLLAQDGWIYPGDPDSGRIHARVWGKGAEKVMPADGLELIARDPAYKALIGTLDLFVATMVPGERRRARARATGRARLAEPRRHRCAARFPTARSSWSSTGGRRKSRCSAAFSVQRISISTATASTAAAIISSRNILALFELGACAA